MGNVRINKCDKYEWYTEADKYIQLRKELNRHINRDELTNNNWGLHSHNWYTFNAPDETNIITYLDFVEWCGFEVYRKIDFTKDEMKEYIINYEKQLGRNLKTDDFRNHKCLIDINDINKLFKNFNSMKKEFGLEETGTYKGKQYSKDELIKLMKNFIKDQGFVPTSKFIEKHGKEYGLPNRKTFNNNVGSWKFLLSECGYSICDTSKKLKHKIFPPENDNKQFFTNLINDYINKYNEIPTMKKIQNYYGMDLKSYYIKYFGSWNNTLKELGLKLNSVSQYTEEELDYSFLSFVDEYDRVPSIRDFNKTGRPSFWVYQQKFGSWAETCIHYGFEPNGRNKLYYMDDGERCDSSYEYDISTWLRANNVKYERNVNYKSFINDYKGKMNCDYVFTLETGEKYYVEMAGFLKTYDFKKLSREEEIYFFKIKYKEKLLKRQQVKYRIITVKDFKEKSLYNNFDFLNIKKSN